MDSQEVNAENNEYYTRWRSGWLLIKAKIYQDWFSCMNATEFEDSQSKFEYFYG